jgi:Na+-transporting NADH:ubiquinone oxidoreductase subunit NqrC
MRKIKAFTIVEIIMVFIVTSLVISMSIGVVLFIFKSFGHNQNRINSKTEILSLMQIIENDLEFSLTDLSYDVYRINIVNGYGKIQYNFRSDKIVRSLQNSNQSLEFNIQSPSFSVSKNDKGVEMQLWSEQSKDTISLHHFFSNRFICIKKGYLKSWN